MARGMQGVLLIDSAHQSVARRATAHAAPLGWLPPTCWEPSAGAHAQATPLRLLLLLARFVAASSRCVCLCSFRFCRLYFARLAGLCVLHFCPSVLHTCFALVVLTVMVTLASDGPSSCVPLVSRVFVLLPLQSCYRISVAMLSLASCGSAHYAAARASSRPSGRSAFSWCV